MAGHRRRRILVVARGHIGDLVQATPALRAIRAHHPDDEITVLANEYTRGLLEGSPDVDRLIYGFAYEERSRGKRLWDMITLWRRLLLRFDVVIALRFSPTPLPLLALAAGARVRSGFDQPGVFGRLLNRNAGPEPKDSNNRVTNLRSLAPLGIEGSAEYRPLSWTSDRAAASAQALLAAHDLAGTPYAVLQVSCNWGCNQLDARKWAEVVDQLVTRFGIRSVVVGTNDHYELEQFEAIRELASHPPVSLHGRTTLAELVEVVRHASLVVATDSALTQIALAEAVPSVVMFGIEPLHYNGPLPSEHGTIEVIQHWDGPELAPTPNPHCRFVGSYCHSEHCRENSSLAATSVNEIVASIDAVLRRNGFAIPVARPTRSTPATS